MSIVLLGAAPNATRGTSQFASSLVFDLPGNAAKYAGSCYNQSGYGRGALQLPKAGWKIELTNAGSADASYVATGPQVLLVLVLLVMLVLVLVLLLLLLTVNRYSATFRRLILSSST